jgi:hypothetical protein
MALAGRSAKSPENRLGINREFGRGRHLPTEKLDPIVSLLIRFACGGARPILEWLPLAVENLAPARIRAQV